MSRGENVDYTGLLEQIFSKSTPYRSGFTPQDLQNDNLALEILAQINSSGVHESIDSLAGNFSPEQTNLKSWNQAQNMICYERVTDCQSHLAINRQNPQEENQSYFAELVYIDFWDYQLQIARAEVDRDNGPNDPHHTASTFDFAVQLVDKRSGKVEPGTKQTARYHTTKRLNHDMIELMHYATSLIENYDGSVPEACTNVDITKKLFENEKPYNHRMPDQAYLQPA